MRQSTIATITKLINYATEITIALKGKLLLYYIPVHPFKKEEGRFVWGLNRISVLQQEFIFDQDFRNQNWGLGFSRGV
jgi:hypothetical protein